MSAREFLTAEVGGPMRAAADRETRLQGLFEELAERPYAFDFFALLRRIEALHPGLPRIGRARRPAQEAVRLGQEAELDFAPAALAVFDRKGGAAPRLGVRFFGLLGSQGPMPLHLTEYVRERSRYRDDPTAARFLDVFHHRLLSLFYRAWAESQPTVGHDRPDADRFAAWLGATFGLGPVHRTQGELPETARLFQAGLLGSRSRHPEGLEKLLGEYFRVPVRVQSHVPHTMTIDEADRSRLGRAAGGERARLGVNVNAGSRVPDRCCKFRVVLGPLTLAAYLGFLPGGKAWCRLRDWIHQYVGLDLRWDVQLCLASAEVPPARLGRRVPLGVAAWLGAGSRIGIGAGAGDGAQASEPSPRPLREAAPARADLRLRPDTSFLLRHGVRHA